MRNETGGPEMMKILERWLGLPMAATYDRVRSVEQKVKDIFPDTEFVLVLGSDDTLHLRVYGSTESRMGVIELVKEDFA
ncbi:MAG: hypothetical protein IIB88_04620 [Chloroflexi bacterium]|nr:hypothetical protein [Chloroflexota bacterium]